MYKQDEEEGVILLSSYTQAYLSRLDRRSNNPAIPAMLIYRAEPFG